MNRLLPLASCQVTTYLLYLPQHLLLFLLLDFTLYGTAGTRYYRTGNPRFWAVLLCTIFLRIGERRLVLPALAHILGLESYSPYMLLSLVCSVAFNVLYVCLLFTLSSRVGTTFGTCLRLLFAHPAAWTAQLCTIFYCLLKAEWLEVVFQGASDRMSGAVFIIMQHLSLLTVLHASCFACLLALSRTKPRPAPVGQAGSNAQHAEVAVASTQPKQAIKAKRQTPKPASEAANAGTASALKATSVAVHLGGDFFSGSTPVNQRARQIVTLLLFLPLAALLQWCVNRLASAALSSYTIYLNYLLLLLLPFICLDFILHGISGRKNYIVATDTFRWALLIALAVLFLYRHTVHLAITSLFTALGYWILSLFLSYFLHMLVFMACTVLVHTRCRPCCSPAGTYIRRSFFHLQGMVALLLACGYCLLKVLWVLFWRADYLGIAGSVGGPVRLLFLLLDRLEVLGVLQVGAFTCLLALIGVDPGPAGQPKKHADREAQ